MKIRLTLAAAAGAALLVNAPIALANHDTESTRVCDTSDDRGGHDAKAGPADVVVPLPGGYEVWAPGGHYVLRGDDAYVEIVGGQGFNRDGNQGGYVQGEVDPAGAPVYADFHANSFAGQNSPNAAGFACVNADVAGQKQKVTTPGGSQP